MQKCFIALALVVACLARPAYADVIEAAERGFVIEIVRTTAQPVDISYQQFLRIAEWWDGNHSWFGKAENFRLDAQTGGCFCETEGLRQVEHMRVIFVDPNREVRLLGGLGPLQMMGVNGAMSWAFTALESGGTQITQRYAVSGYLKGGLAALAPIVDQVQTGQHERLIAKLARAAEME